MSSGGQKNNNPLGVSVDVDFSGFDAAAQSVVKEGTTFFNNVYRESRAKRLLEDTAGDVLNGQVNTNNINKELGVFTNNIRDEINVGANAISNVGMATGKAADKIGKDFEAEIQAEKDKGKAQEAAARLRARQKALLAGYMGRQGTISNSPLTASLGTSPTGKTLLGE